MKGKMNIDKLYLYINYIYMKGKMNIDKLYYIYYMKGNIDDKLYLYEGEDQHR